MCVFNRCCDCSFYKYFSAGCTEIKYSASPTPSDDSGDYVIVKLGEESIKVYDPEKCGLVVEDWIERKPTLGLLTKAWKYPRSISIKQEFDFQFDYSSKTYLCKYRNRLGGQNNNIKVETNTKWRVDLNYFLPQLENILILHRIHYFQNKFQSNAIWRAQKAQ